MATEIEAQFTSPGQGKNTNNVQTLHDRWREESTLQNFASENKELNGGIFLRNS